MDDLNELLAGLKEHWEEDPKAVLEALPRGEGSLYQKVYSRGHGDATGSLKGKTEDLEKELEAEKGRADRAEAKVERLEEDQPDLATVNREWEEKLDARDSEHEEALAEERKLREQALRDQALADLERALVSGSKKRGKVDPVYAGVAKRDVADRIRVDLDNNRVEVLEEGKQIPLQPGDKQSAIDVLANEVYENTDPKWIVEDVDTSGPDASRTTTSSRGKSRFDSIRESVKAEREEKENQPSLDERLPRTGS